MICISQFTTIKKELAFQALAIILSGWVDPFQSALNVGFLNIFIVVIWVKFRTKKSTPLKKKNNKSLQQSSASAGIQTYVLLTILEWAAESRILFIIYLYWLTQTISLPLLISHTPQGSSRPIKWSELVSSCSDLQIQSQCTVHACQMQINTTHVQVKCDFLECFGNTGMVT